MEDDDRSASDGDGDSGEEVPEGVQVRSRMPDERKREMFAIAEQLLGGSRIRVICQDGKGRMARIPGKLKRRMWIREGDLLIVRPWDFQDDKCDVLFRYMKTQSQYMSRRGLIPENLDIF